MSTLKDLGETCCEKTKLLKSFSFFENRNTVISESVEV